MDASRRRTLPSLSFHSLRHSFNSAMANAGTRIMKNGGWRVNSRPIASSLIAFAA